MAKQKDGITDLTKVLISAANKFTDAEYTKLTQVIFAMLHGVNYGYDTMDQRFLNDAQDLKFVHNADKKFKKIIKKKKVKNNVIYISNFSKETSKDDA
jgi:hypothetical protein|tara:strand:- start:14 stop:307 length:294 start_codon:yes stop_codon:yes gene_type:complete